MNPEEKYDKLGRRLLEVHHIVPLNQLAENTRNTLDDLMLVCPNCHRALHKGDAVENLEYLKQQFSADD
jgi:predicted HNH restriction endonuclease